MRSNVSDDYYFKVDIYSRENGFNDIYFEVNDSVSDFPESIIELKNEIEGFIKIIATLFKDDKESYILYYDKLYMLADLAFNGRREQSFLAKNSLDNLKYELIHEVGPRVRTKLLFKYIYISFFPIIIIGLFFLGVNYVEDNQAFPYLSKLILVALGANVGCWLSLAVRTRGIEFDQILPILSDHKGVHSRIIFVMVFSVVLAILMKAGLLSIQLGEFSSSTIETSNYSALSAGFIMGFAEKLFVDKFQNNMNKIKL